MSTLVQPKPATAECHIEGAEISIFRCLGIQDWYAQKGLLRARCYGCRHKIHHEADRQLKRRKLVARGQVGRPDCLD